jgi:hypothetical protein
MLNVKRLIVLGRGPNKVVANRSHAGAPQSDYRIRKVESGLIPNDSVPVKPGIWRLSGGRTRVKFSR